MRAQRRRGFRSTRQTSHGRWVELNDRGEASATAARILAAVRAVDWSASTHAYGPAEDAGIQLEALVVATEEVRRDAWWELWGNIHHQGTVHAATVPAVEILADLAAWPAFPDRRQALHLLDALLTPGEQDAAGPAVRDAARRRTAELVADWRSEPEPVQRALLMLARDAELGHDELCHAVLPDRLGELWAQGGVRGAWALQDDERSFDAVMDAISELESWAFID